MGHKRRFLSTALMIGAAFLVGQPLEASAAPFEVFLQYTNSGGVAFNTENTITPNFDTGVTTLGPLPQLELFVHVPITTASTSFGSATSGLSLDARLGDLSGSAFASASWSGLFQGGSTGRSISDAGWSDTFTVVSATLPQFTLVQLLGTLTLTSEALLTDIQLPGVPPDVRVLAAGGANATLSGDAFAPLSLENSLLNSGTAQDQSMTQSASVVFTEAVGVPFQLAGTLLLFNTASAGFNSDTNVLYPGGISQVLVPGSAAFHLDSLTAGASYVTASGVTYVSPVPEPSSLLLLGSGLVGLAGWRWRKKG